MRVSAHGYLGFAAMASPNLRAALELATRFAPTRTTALGLRLAVEGDLAAGAPDEGPFDVILVNGAFETMPSALLGQLATGGRLVGVDARTSSPRGVIVDKAAAGFSERSLFDAKADVLEAFRRAPGFVF